MKHSAVADKSSFFPCREQIVALLAIVHTARFPMIDDVGDTVGLAVVTRNVTIQSHQWFIFALRLCVRIQFALLSLGQQTVASLVAVAFATT